MATIKTRLFTINRNSRENELDAFFASIGESQILSISTIQVTPDVGKVVVVYKDDVAPTVIATTPSNAQNDVVPETDIIVEFSEDVNLLDSSLIEIRRDGSLIAGFSISISGSTMVISSAIDASASNYTVVIRANAVDDNSDNTLDEDYAFQFSTVAASTGSSIVSLINDSSSIIDSDNIEVSTNLRRQIRNNFVDTVESRRVHLGADRTIEDCFYEDLSTNPGGAFSPGTTTTVIEIREMTLNAGTGLGSYQYWSTDLPVTGATGVRIEADYDGSPQFQAYRDGGTTPTVLSVDAETTITSTTSSVRVGITIPGSGTIVHDYAAYIFS